MINQAMGVSEAQSLAESRAADDRFSGMIEKIVRSIERLLRHAERERANCALRAESATKQVREYQARLDVAEQRIRDLERKQKEVKDPVYGMALNVSEVAVQISLQAAEQGKRVAELVSYLEKHFDAD